MAKYINLTPRWTEILRTWRMIVEANNSAKRNHRNHYNKTMGDFWDEMQRMAQAADNFNDIAAAFPDKNEIENLIKLVREIYEM